MKRIPDYSALIKIAPRMVIVTGVVGLVLTVLTVQCGVSEEEVLERYLDASERIGVQNKEGRWRQVDEVLNQRINNKPKLLSKKIKIEASRAIQEYTKNEKNTVTMTSPIVLQEAKKLGGSQKIILEQAICYTLSPNIVGIRGAWTKPWANEQPCVD